MDKKQAKILYTIKQNTNLTKLDIKNKTGFSMTTVLSSVKKLQALGLITCGQREVKGGKAPSIINTSMTAYVVGVGYSKGVLRALTADLSGCVLEITERNVNETEENISAIIKEISKGFPPSAIGVITENIDYKYCENKQNKNVRDAGDIAEGIANFYRFYSLKSNSLIVVIHLDKKITVLKSGEKNEYVDINNLYSPLINSIKGRLTYQEVLSKDEVLSKLNSKYSVDIEALVNTTNQELIAYRNRLNLTIQELLRTVDRLLNPEIIVIGGYLPIDSIIIDNSEIKGRIFYAGDVTTATAHLASAIALNSLYYYD